MTFFEKLQTETHKNRMALYQVPQLLDSLKGNITLETYIEYLTQAYHHVSHTVRFLMAMGYHLPSSKKEFHKTLAEYIKEEVGHEEWILNDISAAGGDADIARNSTPNLETQLLIAYNYDYIQRKNPMGFFGMVFMLESTSIELASKGANTLQKSLQLPKNAFTYLQSHGELDINHMHFFEKTINGVSDKDDQSSIIEVANNSFILFANMLKSLTHKNGVQDAA